MSILPYRFSNEQAQDIHDAWLDWKLLVFRDQHLNREQHKAFGRRFGKLHVHPMQHKYGGDPEILTVKTTAKSPYNGGRRLAHRRHLRCDSAARFDALRHRDPGVGRRRYAVRGHVPRLRTALRTDQETSSTA